MQLPRNPDGDQKRVNEFIQLFVSHETRLAAFAMSMIPNWADADDLLQEASMVMWKKFDQFHSGSDFFAWAGRILYLNARDFRRRQLRAKVRYSDEFLADIAEEATDMAEELSDRQGLLGECVARLKGSHHRILSLRYKEGITIEQIAESLGRSVKTVYNSLGLIRKMLIECVSRKLATGGDDGL